MSTQKIAPSTSCLNALRAATAPLHGKLETVNPLDANAVSLDAYGLFLKAVHPIFQTLEERIQRLPSELLPGFSYTSRCRTHLIESDLALLGLRPAAASALPFPRVSSAGEALGAAYVLEGSRMGGQLLHRRLAERYGQEKANQFHFFSGGTTDSGKEWRAFLGILEHHWETHNGSDPALLNAAVETFQCFVHAFEQVQQERTTAREASSPMPSHEPRT